MTFKLQNSLTMATPSNEYRLYNRCRKVNFFSTFANNILIVLFGLFSITSIGQIDITVPELTGPSPEVAGLGKYGDIPFDRYTGTSNINVPLYSLNFDGLFIPIGISYSTGGIQASQEATWVGLGWVLSAEPTITRQIKGMCDITLGSGPVPLVGYAYTDIELPNYITDYSQNLEDKLILHSDFNTRTQGWDTQPDIFTVNIFGETASFILKQKALNGGVIGVSYMNSEKRFKIEFIENDKAFIVTNDKGFKFYFSQKEYSITSSGDQSGIYLVTSSFAQKLITGWKLDKIISPNNRQLQFSYQNRTLQQEQPRFFDSKLDFTCETASGASAVTNTPVEGKSLTGHEVLYLSQISTDDTSIEFITSNRLDIPKIGDTDSEITNMANYLTTSSESPKKLDNVVIKYNNVEIINYSFQYTYFNQAFINHSTPKKYLRLKLDSILFNRDFFRGFEYLNAEQLPIKTTKSVDYWGYYNGKNNAFNFPSYYDVHSCLNYATGQYFDQGLSIPGADRRSDFNYGKNGLLNKVIYPTKGYSKLVYEPHTILLDNNNRITQYPFEDDINIELTSTSESQPAISDNFTFINTDQQAGFSRIRCQLKIACGDEFENADGSFRKCEVDPDDVLNSALEIYNSTTGQLYKKFVFSSDPNCVNVGSGVLCPPLNLTQENGYVASFEINLNDIPNGNYYFKITALNEPSDFYDEDDGVDYTHPDYYKPYHFAVRLTLGVPKSITIDKYDKEIGGARIKSIENYDDNNILLTKRDYEYKLSGESAPGLQGFSSGLLINDLIFSNSESRFFRDEGNSGSCGFNPSFAPTGDPNAHLYGVTEVYSQNIHASNAPSSSFIGYSRVAEIYANNSNQDNIGKRVDYFSNKENLFTRTQSSNIIFPAGDETLVPLLQIAFYPERSYEESNGDLLKEEFYDNAENLLKQIVYSYDFHDYYPPRSIATGLYPRISTQHWFNCNSYIGVKGLLRELQIYPIKEETTPLIKKVETDFVSGSEISTTNEYVYNDRFLQSTIRNYVSNGNELIQKLYYPDDVLTTSSLGELLTSQEKAAIDLLNKNNLHRISEPVQTETILKDDQGTLLSKTTQRANYRDWGNNQVSVNTIESSKNDDPLEERIKYHSYDSFGNPREISKTNGIHIVYLWGYNNTSPIAKIENTTFAQVAAALGVTEAVLATYDESNLAAINSLRTTMNGAMITTYTYKPLVGITTITDPKGNTMNYVYDDFNRLQSVKDTDGNLVSDYQYKFKTLN